MSDRRLSWLLAVLACAWIALAWRTEVTVDPPDLNDHVYHLGLAARMDAAWSAGEDPLDVWIPYNGQGYPVVRTYQHLPHATVVLVHQLLRGAVPLEAVFDAARLLLLVLSPLAWRLGARWLGLGPIASGMTALCVPLLATAPERYLFGFQLTGFTWAGGGLFPQLFAMVLMPLSLGALSRAALGGRRFGPALALTAATWLCHLLVGYATCLLGLLVLARPEAAGRRLVVGARLAGLYAATGVAVSYLLAPALLEGRYLNRSIWESPIYWDSFGARRVLGLLARGALLDGRPVPVLTALAGLGLVVAAAAGWRRRDAAPDGGGLRFAALAFVAALLLFFGRPTWGRLLAALPFSGSMPLHRLVCAVHLGGLLLAGAGLGWLFVRVRGAGGPARVAAAALVVAAALAPAAAPAWRAAAADRASARAAAANLRQAGAGLAALLAEIRAADRSRPGRGYAGARWDWGYQFLLASAPIYTYWTAHDLPAIGYLFHTMGLNSDLDPEFDAARRDHHDLWNVRHLLVPDESYLPPFAEVRGRRPGVVWAEVETRGELDLVTVDAAVHARDGRELHAFNRVWVRSRLPGARRHARVSLGRERAAALPGERVLRGPADVAAEEAAPAPAEPGRVVAQWGRFDRFGADVEVEAATGAHVLLRATFHPGWRATVDGRPARTVMLSPSYVGVPVAPGRHRIEVRYVPWRLRRGLLALGAAIVGLALLADRLRAWPSCRDEPRPARRRVALEALAVAAAILGVLLAAGAPIG